MMRMTFNQISDAYNSDIPMGLRNEAQYSFTLYRAMKPGGEKN
jgi:hypothetical protein